MNINQAVGIITGIAQQHVTGTWYCVKYDSGIAIQYWDEDSQRWSSTPGTVYTSEQAARLANTQGFPHKIYE